MPSKPSSPLSVSAMLIAVLAAGSMATIGVFSRITELPALSVTFYRLFIGSLFMACWLAAKQHSFKFDRQDNLGLLATGAFLAGFIVCYIEAMNRTLMANAILMVYLAPIVAALYTRIFHAEKLNRIQIIAMTLALSGFVLMQDLSQTSHSVFFNSGMAFAALAMLFYAAFIIQNRTIRGSTPASTRTFWQLLIGALFILPATLLTQTSLQVAPEQWGWLLLIGFLPGFIAIFAAIVALERLPTAVYGTLTYMEPVSVIIFGWVLFQEHLSLQQILGVLLILISGIGQGMLQKRA